MRNNNDIVILNKKKGIKEFLMGNKKEITICGEVFKTKRSHFYFDTRFKQIGNMKELKKLQEFPNLESISLNATSINDTGLQHIGQCNSITNINLTFTSITDKGISHLVNLKKIKHLRLKETNISKNSIQYFNQMSSLISLQVHETEISGKDMGNLNLTNLEELLIDCDDDEDYSVLLALSERLPTCEIISKGKGVFSKGIFNSNL